MQKAETHLRWKHICLGRHILCETRLLCHKRKIPQIIPISS